MNLPTSSHAPGQLLVSRSIGRKMAGIIVSVLMLATTVTFFLSAWLSIHHGLRGASENLQTIVDTTGQIIEAPLAFNDQKGAQDVLQSLSKNPTIAQAQVSDVKRKVIAEYSLKDYEPAFSNWGAWLPLPKEQTIERAILLNGRLLGTLSMRGRLDTVWYSQADLLLKMASVYIAAWLLALFLARRQSTRVTNPISQAAATAVRIAREGDYSLRLQVVTADEVGLLGGAFNQMLDAVVKRERDLRESEGRMHTLLNALPDLVWFKTVDGVYKFCNPRFEQMFGAAESDIVGKTDYDFVDRELADFFREHDRKALEQDDLSVNEEWVSFASDGHRELLETSKTPVYNLDGYVIGVLGIGHDITDRKRVEVDLQVAATAFESQEGMFVTDAKRAILRVNRAFTQITGYCGDDALGQTPSMLNADHLEACIDGDTWACVERAGSWHGEIWNRRKNGEVYPVDATITAVKNANGEITNHVGTLTDITVTRAAADKIMSLAFYDSLTALPNRRLLMDRLTQALASSARSGAAGALLFIDLDNFKTLNDTLGHDVGDSLLKQVAARLSASVREGDTVARLGGDEFVLMLEDLAMLDLDAAEQAKAVGNKMLHALNQPYQLGVHEIISTASVGATLFRGHESNVDELLKQADIAMYQCKTSGRNGLRFFDPKMQESINERAALETELRKALERQQFQLHYQIQLDSEGRPLGAEVLIRWLHPERGLVPPMAFISLAEETGLILPIGRWALVTACAQLGRWQQHSHTCELVLAVNVSAKQFRQSDFVAQVKDVIAHHGINPALLKLELTESLLLESIDDTISTMRELQSIGVQFSLDDFGTGYSSLQYLKLLPLQQLKIDMSFVRDIVVNSSDQAIVRTIIAMAESLNLTVIAEGVETEEQRRLLLSMGCQHFQGYLLGKPVPIDHFEFSLKHRAESTFDRSVKAA